MKVTKTKIPQLPPPHRYIIELSEDEARILTLQAGGGEMGRKLLDILREQLGSPCSETTLSRPTIYS